MVPNKKFVKFFEYFASPFARKKKLSSMEKILLSEESKAEITISKVRIVILSILLSFTLFRYFNEGNHSFISILPNLIFLLFSIGLHYKISIISSHTDLIEKYYFAIIKYVIILYDTVFFTWIIYSIFFTSDVSDWSIFALYIVFYAFLVITDIFRYDFFSSIYCGIVIFLSRFILFTITDSGTNPLYFIINDKPHIQNILFMLSIILFTLLSCLISMYIRKVIEKSKKQDTLEKYVPEMLAREIMTTDKELSLSGTRGNVTILFSDIRNFTTISEKLSPEEVISFLNDYFQIMINIIFKYDGMLDKIIGDGLMAIFGSPFAIDSNPELNAQNAVKAAIEMDEALEDLNKSLINRGLTEIQIGIGINSGEAVLGDIGTDKRTEFTAIGDVVNTASRIEGYTKEVSKSILMSESTNELININTESIGYVELKGKKDQVHLFKILN